MVQKIATTAPLRTWNPACKVVAWEGVNLLFVKLEEAGVVGAGKLGGMLPPQYLGHVIMSAPLTHIHE